MAVASVTDSSYPVNAEDGWRKQGVRAGRAGVDDGQDGSVRCGRQDNREVPGRRRQDGWLGQIGLWESRYLADPVDLGQFTNTPGGHLGPHEGKAGRVPEDTVEDTPACRCHRRLDIAEPPICSASVFRAPARDVKPQHARRVGQEREDSRIEDVFFR